MKKQNHGGTGASPVRAVQGPAARHKKTSPLLEILSEEHQPQSPALSASDIILRNPGEFVDDIQAIRLAKTELREAYRTANVKRVLAVISDAYSEMPTGLASFWGEEAKAVLEHRLKQTFARYRAELAVTIISISIMGNMAFDWGWHKLKLTAKKGRKTITKKTRYLELWQKEVDGQWRIVIFMDNADLKPQMPPLNVLKAVKKRAA